MTDTLIELRVHGVAGTSPESMLGLGARLKEPAPDGCGRPPAEAAPVQVGVYGRPAYDQASSPVDAFSWGGLTSGRPSTARWLLLLPFVLFNAAGWATLPPVSTPTFAASGPSRSSLQRAHTALVRLGGLLLTGVTAGLVTLLVADLGVMQIAFTELDWLAGPGRRHVFRALGLVTAAALMVGLWYWTRLRLRPDAPRDRWSPASDPAGYGRLHDNQQAMWNHPGIISRLRSLHLGFALGVIGWIGAIAPVWRRGELDSAADGGWAAAVTAVAIVLPAIWILVFSLGPGRDGENVPVSVFARWMAPVLGFAAVGVGASEMGQWTPEEGVGTIPALRGTLIAMCALLVVVVISTWANQAILRRQRSGTDRMPFRTTFTVPSLMLLSVALMAAAGTSLALISVQAVGGKACETDPTMPPCKFFVGDALDWVAIAYTVALVGSVVVGGIAIAVARGTPMERVKQVVTKPARVFGWILAIGGVISAVLIAVVGTRAPGLPSGPESGVDWLTEHRDDVALYAGMAAGVVILAIPLLLVGWQTMRYWGLILAGAAIAAVAWAISAGKQVSVLGVPLPPLSGIQAVTAVGLLLPLGAVATRIVAGMRSADARRGIGVLWDLGMFWPRWYHPFTPPTYSDRAVTDLTDKLHRYLTPDNEAAPRGEPSHYDCVVVSAHSQGSVLATAALLLHSQKHPSTPLKSVGLITHGSPWGRLYSELFPSVFSSEALAGLQWLLTGPNVNDKEHIRWRNLQRKTDPIGGPIVDAHQPWLMANPDTFRLEVDRDTEDGSSRTAASDDPCNRLHSDYTLEPGYPTVVQQLRDLVCPARDGGG